MPTVVSSMLSANAYRPEGASCPHRRAIFVRNDVKEKLARGGVVMLPILLHQNR
jgi:hypothetical protein